MHILKSNVNAELHFRGSTEMKFHTDAC